jgi:flagellar basal body-associated protein FliL
MGASGKTGGKTSRSDVVLLIAAIFIIAVTAFVFFLLRASKAAPTYTVADHTLTISGQYGAVIDLEGADAALESGGLPETETRTNGAAIGSIAKGYYRLDGAEVYLNVMDTAASEYIRITDRSGYKFYIICATPEETAALYAQIEAALK